MKRFIYIFQALLIVLSSCAKETFVEPPDTGGNIVFSSYKSRIITKDGLQYVDFEKDILYQLYGLPSITADNPAYDWNDAVLYNTRGRETGNHTIDYGDPISFGTDKYLDFYGVTANKMGRTLSQVSRGGSVRENPVFFVQRENHAKPEAIHTMPDLMCSNNLKNCVQEDGLLEMKFVHEMSKITFQINRQEGAFPDAVLTGIEIIGGTWTQGKFDVVNDSWELADADKCSAAQVNRYFSGSLNIGEQAVDVPYTYEAGGTGPIKEMLIIPNAPGLNDNAVKAAEPLKVRISYSVGGVAKIPYEVEIKKVRADANGNVIKDPDGNVVTENYNFLKNHHYRLGITLLENGVQVFAIKPMMYDWIDRDMQNGTEVVLGQPVTFENVMWMDRNLGATTADAVNDFYHSIGYYYQFGRNIPYILDIDKWVAYVNDNNVKAMTNTTGDINVSGPLVMFRDEYDNKSLIYSNPDYILGQDGINNRNNPAAYYKSHYDLLRFHPDKGAAYTPEAKAYLRACPYECIYTYDQNGKKVYGITYPQSLKELARFPGDEPSGSRTDSEGGFNIAYRFVSFKNSDKHIYFNDDEVKCEKWLSNELESRNLWDSPENHPCPKGWRLPTRKDLYAFMPEETNSKLDWANPFYPVIQKTDEAVSPNYYVFLNEDGTVKEEARYGIVNDGTESFSVVYMLKNRGKADAYRIMIRSHRSAIWTYTANFNGTDNKGEHDSSAKANNKHAITISRFPAGPYDTLSDYVGFVEGDDKHLSPGVWDNPSESMSFPAAGYIVTDGLPDLRTFGLGSVIRTSEPVIPSEKDDKLGRARSWVLYLSTTNNQVAIADNSRRSLGDQVRCVRDVEAND